MGDASVGFSPYVKYGICLKYRPSITYALNFEFHVPLSSSIYLHYGTSDFLVKESSRERHPEDVLFHATIVPSGFRVPVALLCTLN